MFCPSTAHPLEHTKEESYALKIDPFGTSRNFLGEKEVHDAYDILHAIRTRFGADLKIMIDVHSRLAPAEAVRVAKQMRDLDLLTF